MRSMPTDSNMETKVFPNRPNSPSLRATIPRGIVAALKLIEGDSIRWDIEARGGQIVVVVTKAEG